MNTDRPWKGPGLGTRWSLLSGRGADPHPADLHLRAALSGAIEPLDVAVGVSVRATDGVVLGRSRAGAALDLEDDPGRHRRTIAVGHWSPSCSSSRHWTSGGDVETGRALQQTDRGMLTYIRDSVVV